MLQRIKGREKCSLSVLGGFEREELRERRVLVGERAEGKRTLFHIDATQVILGEGEALVIVSI